MKRFLVLLLLHSCVFALPVDEKLTMRFLEVSKSKKTVLINRGLEDGLVIGDHAKFFVSKGVIARGVVVKASPSRSIWSVYRLVSPGQVEKSKVLNLKIATPVRLTDDPSKSLYAMASSDTQMGEPVDIINTNQNNKTVILKDSMTDTSELRALMGESEASQPRVESRNSSSHSMEVWALASLSSLAGTYTSADADYTATNSSISFSGGLEKYFPTSSGFLRNFSLKGFVNYNSTQTESSISQTTTITDMGLGLSYYFGNNGPFSSGKFTFFIDGNMGLSTTVLTTTETLEGSGTFYSVGLGTKYMVNGKFGGFSKLDYYSSVTTFEVDLGTELVTEEYGVAGPRFMVGMFYRFF